MRSHELSIEVEMLEQSIKDGFEGDGSSRLDSPPKRKDSDLALKFGISKSNSLTLGLDIEEEEKHSQIGSCFQSLKWEKLTSI